MQKWEYKLWDLEDVSDVPEEAMNIPGYFRRKLKQLGLEGWELVWITKRGDVVFKRPIEIEEAQLPNPKRSGEFTSVGRELA